MNHLNGPFRLELLALLLTGCAANLSILPEEVRDRSEPAAVKPFEVSAIMVLPPQGSERGQQSELAQLEQFLLGKGFRVISSGITGRVASESVEARADEASRLSDLERALILGEKSHADAILQVGKLGFEPRERYFTVLKGDRENFAEVPEPPESSDSYRLRVRETRFTFKAKLINVKNGEVMILMDFSQSTSRVAPPFHMAVPLNDEETLIKIDTRQRREAAMNQAMQAFSSRIYPPTSQPAPRQ